MITQKRIDIVDVLRGFSIMAIFLIHSIEHFNFYSFPQIENEWLKFSDKIVWDSLFFAFSGKAYCVFALLFGLSFFIQDNNQMKKGADFRGRFAWRLVLLFLWGIINGIFFTGEILAFYGMMGFVLIPVARLNTKTVFVIALILMLQPVEWGKMIYAICNPEYVPGESMIGYYFGKAYEVQIGGTFLETMRVNLWEGQLANLAYAWEYGRVFQTASLFMLGMLAGRTQIFLNTENNLRWWRRTLVISILCFFPLNGLQSILPEFITNQAILTPMQTILKTWSNLMFMLFFVSIIIVAYYQSEYWHNLLGKFAPYGMMSLTCYITQSIIGSMLYYNWGFALHDKLSVTASFLIGIILFLLQLAFARWWMKSHRHGPLEFIWKKATWIGAKK